MICNLVQITADANGNGDAVAYRPAQRLDLVEWAMSRFFNSKTTAFLLALIPQSESSPALQSLFMSLFLVASGTATHLLNSLICARGSTFRHVSELLLGWLPDVAMKNGRGVPPGPS